MTIPTNRKSPPYPLEARRPTFPIEQQSGAIFLGWGPKL